MTKFASRAKAFEAVSAALAETRDGLIFVTKPDYQKRGKAKNRFPFYAKCMLASQYIDKCIKAGYTEQIAKRDLHHDEHVIEAIIVCRSLV